MTDIRIDVVDAQTLRSVDIDRLNALESQIFGTEGYPRYFFRQAAVVFDGTFLVARAPDDAIVGYALSALNQHSLDEGWILSMCVDVHKRRHGIGSELLTALCSVFAQKRATHVCVTLDLSNKLARALYEKHGFKMVKLLEDYHGSGYHRYLLKKTL